MLTINPLQQSPWPQFPEDEQAAVLRVLQSGKVNYWTGEEGRLFEQEFALYCGVRFGVAVANGTLALEAALHACGIGPGDEVIVPARTFIATASAVVARGATPVVADVEIHSQNLSAETITPLITGKTKAFICVHLNGLPCDMQPIVELAAQHGCRVIEDCAQAHGAEYRGRKVGSLGDIAAFSFCQDKIMTTGGEGGMVVTNDETLWQRAWQIKDHGKSHQRCYSIEHPPGFRWLHAEFGSNWRLSEMQAAIGRVQLRKLDDWLVARSRHAENLTQQLSAADNIKLMNVPADVRHAYYKFCCYIKDDQRDAIMQEFNREGIVATVGVCPDITCEDAFAAAGYRIANPRPNAEWIGQHVLQFTVHP